MIGEKIEANLLNTQAAKAFISHFDVASSQNKIVIAIAGESGSGKTHMAKALANELLANKIHAHIIHMDDFFILPPASNHAQRLRDISNVGPQEVNIARLNTLISAFKSNASNCSVPIVNYYENSISESNLDLGSVRVLIIEGTYGFFLNDTDFHLFMSRNFEQTKELRLARNRGNEAQDEFIERVLRIEHELIVNSAVKADANIDYHFNLQFK